MLAFKRSFALVQQRPQFFAMPAQRAFATWEDKTRGEEKSYFSKKDAKLLKALVEKMEARDEQASEAAQEHNAMQDDLSAIFENHGLAKEGKDSLLWQELMEWRRTKY